jgi:hypothetical protein
VRTVKKPRVAKSKLSFAVEDEEEGGEESPNGSENGEASLKGTCVMPFMS